MYRHLFVVRAALEAMRHEVRCAPTLKETGGALLGYVSRDDAIVVTHASGPGPGSILQRYSVEIDGKYTTAFAAQVRHQTEGRIDYIGDWHRHPGWSLVPSEGDLQAMTEIQNSRCCSVSFPISVIYRSWPEKVRAYVFIEDSMMPVGVSLIERIPGV